MRRPLESGTARQLLFIWRAQAAPPPSQSDDAGPSARTYCPEHFPRVRSLDGWLGMFYLLPEWWRRGKCRLWRNPLETGKPVAEVLPPNNPQRVAPSVRLVDASPI